MVAGARPGRCRSRVTMTTVSRRWLLIAGLPPHTAVYLAVPGGVVRPGAVAGDPLPGARTQFPAQLRVVEQLLELLRERARVERREQQAGLAVPHDLGERPHRADQHR